MHALDATTAKTQTHILVVDDDTEISDLLARYLDAHGYRVSVAGNGAELRSAIREHRIDLILLDLGLPDEDGLTLLRQFQHEWYGPVIVVSGRGESVERVIGLELGADDYITKPFDLRELLARVRSVLRRTQQKPPDVSTHKIEFDGLELDLSARRLFDRNGQEIILTCGEYELLQTLLERPNQVLTRDQLMNCTHGRNTSAFDRAIDVQIGRLRHKIEADPTRPQLIKSVRGAGYIVTVPVKHL